MMRYLFLRERPRISSRISDASQKRWGQRRFCEASLTEVISERRLSAGFCPFLLPFALLLAGCSGPSSPGEEAEVSGTVLYKGKPLSGGLITFTNSKGYNTVAIIDPQGHYQCKPLVGEAQIAVDNRMLQQQKSSLPSSVPKEAAKSQGAAIHGVYVHLPEKYYVPESSGLKYNFTKGTQTHDITLE